MMDVPADFKHFGIVDGYEVYASYPNPLLLRLYIRRQDGAAFFWDTDVYGSRHGSVVIAVQEALAALERTRNAKRHCPTCGQETTIGA